MILVDTEMPVKLVIPTLLENVNEGMDDFTLKIHGVSTYICPGVLLPVL